MPHNTDKFSISIFGETTKPVPIVYLPAFQKGEGRKVWDQCKKIGTKQFVLVEITDFDWYTLSPWPSKTMFPGENNFPGGGETMLHYLNSCIIPKAEKDLNPNKRVIAGYSLAGLFAVWSAYNTDKFEAIISGSGTLYFPGFQEYIKENDLNAKIKVAYFSIGDQESKTRNHILNSNEPITREVSKFYETKGIITNFTLNNGNHYMQSEWRIAKGIQWTLHKLKDIK